MPFLGHNTWPEMVCSSPTAGFVRLWLEVPHLEHGDVWNPPGTVVLWRKYVPIVKGGCNMMQYIHTYTYYTLWHVLGLYVFQTSAVDKLTDVLSAWRHHKPIKLPQEQHHAFCIDWMRCETLARTSLSLFSWNQCDSLFEQLPGDGSWCTSCIMPLLSRRILRWVPQCTPWRRIPQSLWPPAINFDKAVTICANQMALVWRVLTGELVSSLECQGHPWTLTGQFGARSERTS